MPPRYFKNDADLSSRGKCHHSLTITFNSSED